MTVPGTFRNCFNGASLARCPETHLDPVSPPEQDQWLPPPNETYWLETFAFLVLPSIKKEQRLVQSPLATCGGRLPSPVHQLPLPLGQRGDPHLLPPAPAAMLLPTRPRRAAPATPRFRGGSARRRGCPPFRTAVTVPALKSPPTPGCPGDPAPQTETLQVPASISPQTPRLAPRLRPTPASLLQAPPW